MIRSLPSTLQATSVTVTLEGLTDIMFDRYPGSNNIVLPWHDKIYLTPGTDILSLPVINVISFFTAQNTMSAPKRVLPPKTYKNVCNACMSFLLISSRDPDHPDHIPFTRNGEPIRVGAFDNAKESKSGLYLSMQVARLKDGIPNPKDRPVLPLPWELVMRLTLIENEEINFVDVHNLLLKGGISLGSGTFRGQYGKFTIKSWETEE